MKSYNLGIQLFHNLDKFIASEDLQGREIVLFGKNPSSEAMEMHLSQRGIAVAAYLDNDRSKTGTHAPEEYLVPFREGVRILIASKYYPAMARQLIALGYSERKNIRQIVDFITVDESVEPEWTSGCEKMTDAEVRATQVGILRHLHRICEENGLRYTLSSGSLLGAVRHRGFIPWDDDIDINLPYPDYRCLMKLLSEDPYYRPIQVEEYPNGYSAFVGRVEDTRTITRRWEYPFLFLSGVAIDVFPVWGVPKEEPERTEHFERIRALRNELTKTYILDPFNTDETLGRRKALVEEVYRMMEAIPFDEAETVGYALGCYGKKELMPRRLYDSYIGLTFEGETFRAIEGYDEYLTALYGDYMTPPEHKESNHAYIAYRRGGQ